MKGILAAITTGLAGTSCTAFSVTSGISTTGYGRYHDDNNGIKYSHSYSSGRIRTGQQPSGRPLQMIQKPTIVSYSLSEPHKNVGFGVGSLRAAKEGQDDVNDLFSAYMAQRTDKPLMGGYSDNQDKKKQEPPNNSAETYPGQRLFRKISGGGSNSTEGQNLVQHIPLGEPSPLPAPESPQEDIEDALEKDIKLEGKDDKSVQPPNPPSLLPTNQKQLEDRMEALEETYKKFKMQMKAKLDEQKLNDPSSVPDNAYDILAYVVREQKAFDVRELNQQHALESFDQYEARMMEEMRKKMNESSDDSENDKKNDALVQEIFKEAEETHNYQKKQQEEFDKFKDYERSLRMDLRKRQMEQTRDMNMKLQIQLQNEEAGGNGKGNSDPDDNFKNPKLGKGETVPGPSQKSFDELQLELLKDLLVKRNQAAEDGGFFDEDIYLTDNIEDGIRELEERIARGDASSSAAQPDSLKEWQMYRAIATKLANRRKDGETTRTGTGTGTGTDIDTSDPFQEDSDVIRNKVEEWKEFQQKEEEMRRKSGLTIEVRMPFEWGDKPDINDDDLAQSDDVQKMRGPIDREKAEQAKTELDDLALKVLTDLMDKTQDPERRQKLSREIEDLKEGIKARQEALKKRGPEAIKKKKIVPITIGEALRGGTKAKSSVRQRSSVAVEDTSFVKDNDEISNDVEVSNDNEIEAYEDDYDDEDFDEDEGEDYMEPPPDSAFFRDVEEIEGSAYGYQDEEEESDPEKTGDNDEESSVSLGTLEQQKFRSLVARSGVRTVEGQNELKQQWEEFQEAEKRMREISGLSVGGQPTPVETAKVDYDVNGLFKDDGDIDFDKILTSIGTRPSRKNSGQLTSTSASVSPPSQGGGVAVAEAPPATVTEAEDVEIKPSPKSEEDVPPSKMAIVSNPETVGEVKEDTTQEKPQVPERATLGFDLGGKHDTERKFLSGQYSGYEKRKADLLEYPILSVAQIDSLIALKSSPYSSGVSPYLARQNKPFQSYGAIFSLEGVLVDMTGLQYEAWKATANTYDLSLPPLEDVRFAAVHSEEFAIQKIFYWTDDVFAIKKIAKTYRETRKNIFDERKNSENSEDDHPKSDGSSEDNPSTAGDEDAVDVESEIIQLQLTAWKRAARSYGFEAPDIESVKVVSGMEPNQAIRSIFRWTNDFVISSDVGSSYRKYLKEETAKWVKKGGGVPSTFSESSKTTETLDGSPSLPKKSAPDFEDIIQMKRSAWDEAINEGKYNLSPPTFDEIRVAEFAGVEKAMQTVFKWDISPERSASIISDYKAKLKALTQEWFQKVGDPNIESQASSSEEPEHNLPLCTVKDSVKKWLAIVEDIEIPCALISHMDIDLVNDILEETGLSVYFPPELRVSADSVYDSEMQQLLGGALRLERRPDHCIVFTATPQSAGACHEVEMKNVALVSPYPYYELTTADMTVRDFSSIGVRNLKNVFSEITADEPMQMLQVQSEAPKVLRQTMLKTRFWDDE